MKIIKKHFTLLEIMITMVLLGISFSIIGLNIRKALYKHNYENNIKKFESYTEFCKKMAFSNQADVYMVLSQTENKVSLKIGTSWDMGFFKNIKKTKDSLDNMHLLFNDEKFNQLEIVFTSNGNIFPSGVFLFIDEKETFSPFREKEI